MSEDAADLAASSLIFAGIFMIVPEHGYHFKMYFFLSVERDNLMNVIGIKVDIIGGLPVPEQFDQGAGLKHGGKSTGGRLPRRI